MASYKDRKVPNPIGLVELYTFRDDATVSSGLGDESSIDSEIVAVHGLNGHALATWTEPETGVLWLRDLLPKRRKNIRVWAFGYDATILFNSSKLTVREAAASLLALLWERIRESDEAATRQIIFIAHSLGGIVVKQALVDASNDPKYKSIEVATTGIAFFGTPHRGSDFASWGLLAGRLASAAFIKVHFDFLKILKRDSHVLADLSTTFRLIAPRYNIVSFYEELDMPGLGSLIVEKSSSLMEITEEEAVPLASNHREMCRFNKIEDLNYVAVAKRIDNLMKRGLQSSKKLWKAASAINRLSSCCCFSVPYTANPFFSGRRSILSDLERRLTQDDRQRRLALWGLGGAGKTQIALRYCYEHRDEYRAILWVSATDGLRLTADVTALNSSLGLPPKDNKDEAVAAVKNWLADKGQWLLVFDNADNLDEVDLRDWLPAADHGHVIITSRDPRSTRFGCGIEVSAMMPEEATDLLIKRAHLPGHNFDRAEEAGEVVKELGYLALAIDLAGAYMFLNQLSAPEYLQLYQRFQLQLLALTPSLPEYNQTVWTTWKISFDRLQLRNPRAARLLQLFVWLDGGNIEKRYLCLGASAKDRFLGSGLGLEISPGKSGLTVKDVELLSDDLELHAAFQEILYFSLATRRSDNHGFSVHPLVQFWLREGLHKDQLSWVTLTVNLVGHVTPRRHILWYHHDPGSKSSNAGQFELSHIERCYLHSLHFDDYFVGSLAASASDLLLRAVCHSSGNSVAEVNRARDYHERARQLSSRTKDASLLHFLHFVDQKMSIHYGQSKESKNALCEEFLATSVAKIQLPTTNLESFVARQQEGLEALNLSIDIKRFQDCTTLVRYLDNDRQSPNSLITAPAAIFNALQKMFELEARRLYSRALIGMKNFHEAEATLQSLLRKSQTLSNKGTYPCIAVELSDFYLIQHKATHSGDLIEKSIHALDPLLCQLEAEPSALEIQLLDTMLREVALKGGRALLAQKNYARTAPILHHTLVILKRKAGIYTWDFCFVGMMLAEMYAAAGPIATTSTADAISLLQQALEGSIVVWQGADRLMRMAELCAETLDGLGDILAAKRARDVLEKLGGTAKDEVDTGEQLRERQDEKGSAREEATLPLRRRAIFLRNLSFLRRRKFGEKSP